MAKSGQPVLSVIVRRFKAAARPEIQASLARLQAAAAQQSGYMGGQNDVSETDGICEITTVFAFDTRTNLSRWEKSDVRNVILTELNQHPQESPNRTTFEGLAILLHPASTLQKFEVVLILIFWILLIGAGLGFLADITLPPTVPPIVRQVLIVTLNVVLISYVLLPWSSKTLTALKARFSGAAKGP